MVDKVFILGPKHIKNEIMSCYLSDKMGIECPLIASFSSAFADDQAETRGKIFLVDCFGKKVAELLTFIAKHANILSSKSYIALYDLDCDTSIEKPALNYGVRGFFYRNDPPELLLKGIGIILDGEIWISRRKLAECFPKEKIPDLIKTKPILNLTDREKEILTMLSTGDSNEVIADKCSVSTHTIRTHIYNIYKKISVKNRLQAARWATKHL